MRPTLLTAMGEPGPLLAVERAKVLASIEGLRRDFARMVTASQDSNADDEHDPEGATIAFERAQLAALLSQSQRRLVEVEAALERVGSGRYSWCQACGHAIGAERLAARPAAGTCISCAGRGRPGGPAAGLS